MSPTHMSAITNSIDGQWDYRDRRPHDSLICEECILDPPGIKLTVKICGPTELAEYRLMATYIDEGEVQNLFQEPIFEDDFVHDTVNKSKSRAIHRYALEQL